jgi:(2Fe-2S) ferredoxin
LLPPITLNPSQCFWSHPDAMKSAPYPLGETVVLVCTQCKNKKILKAVRDEVKDRGLRKRVRVLKTGCLGACDDGPNVLVSNGKTVLFSGVSPSDAPTLVSAASHSLKD